MTDTTEPTEYPECKRMRAVSDESQSIGAFIEWLTEQGLEIIDPEKSAEARFPVHIGLTIEQLLAKYFEIDLDLVETERRAMLETLRVKLDE